ncbi:hypothetical protein Salat_0655000 [Sesamum alatum]|uniref:Uncharacterized protein n=1 Tax=Sesamum alatum TaxID=300844 RepID=A0AAE1YRI9_9LAMI|nr:hypothetical protein Salat_0655000 [Sesamum alatum]
MLHSDHNPRWLKKAQVAQSQEENHAGPQRGPGSPQPEHRPKPVRTKLKDPFSVDLGCTPMGGPWAMSRASIELDRYQPARIKHVVGAPPSKGEPSAQRSSNLSCRRISPQPPC